MRHGDKKLSQINDRLRIAYPFLAPPGVPQDRVDALRSAFLQAMTDPELLADARKARLEILPASGAEVQKLVAELYATPAPVVGKAVDMLK
jgi:tripartite-type tricarboxylate transporter receptor subunit TctC